MAIQANVSWLQLKPAQFLHRYSFSTTFLFPRLLNFTDLEIKKKSFKFRCRSSQVDDEGYLLDAPESIGDGFSFSGGKYSDGSSPSDEWFKQGKIVKALPVFGTGEKAKDPIFGLAMGGSSQASDDVFRVYHLKMLCIHDFVK